MSPPRDPPRLLDPGADTPEWFRSPMEAGLRDVPAQDRLARIAAGLPGGPAGPGPSSPQPPSAPVAPAAPLPSALSGAVVGAALGIAVVGAGWLASSRSPSVAQAPRPAPVASASLALPAEPRPPIDARAPSTRSRPPAERPGLAAPVSAHATPGSAASSAAPEPPPAAAAAAEDPGPEPGSVTAEPELPAAEPESAILLRAHDALAGSPSRALALTDLHLARYPGGQLAQDREVIAVAALLGMGRAADARARAERFLAAYPTSGDRRRLVVLIPDLESSAGAHKEPSARPSTP